MTVGIDFDVASDGLFYTLPGYLSVPATGAKDYNVTTNGITFEIVGTSTDGNQARFRGFAANAGTDLTRDFQQWYSVGGVPEAAVTLSGLTPNADYTVSFTTYNAGSGATIHSFYEGTVATGTLLSEFTSGGAITAGNRQT